jgi:hypothetical protein
VLIEGNTGGLATKNAKKQKEEKALAESGPSGIETGKFLQP